MDRREIEKSGFYIVLINVVLTAFLLTSKDNYKMFILVALFSNVIAIIYNSYLVYKATNKMANIISLIINIIVMLIVGYIMIVEYAFI